MSFYIGKTEIGNFTPSKVVDSVKDYTVEKMSGRLYLCKNGAHIPLSCDDSDEDSKMVVEHFSDNIGDGFSESIYELKFTDKTVIVILYVYNRVFRLDEAGASIVIHMRNEDEHEAVSEGYNNLIAVDSREDVPARLENLFISNHSVFLQPGTKRDGTFAIYGDGVQGKLQMEKPGLYVIEKIHHWSDKEHLETLDQYFGNIKFVTYKQSLAEEGNAGASIESPRANQIMDAWNEYMRFEEDVYKDNLKNHLYRYSSMERNGEQLSFLLADGQSLNYEDIRNIEFEFIAKSMLKPGIDLPQDGDGVLALIGDASKFKNVKQHYPVFVKTMLNDECDFSNGSVPILVFEEPERELPPEVDEGPGILYASNSANRIAERRRSKVIWTINSKKNESANMIMRLAEKNVQDLQLLGSYAPINNRVLHKMFGDNPPTPNENYRNAMNIALNTPDIALIQGPPGTGKTTLIKGIVARLNDMGKSYHLLVSAEQHEALDNVITKLSSGEVLPPFVSSKRLDSNELGEVKNFEKSLNKFQTNCENVCKTILGEERAKDRYSVHLTKFVAEVQEIKDDGYSIASVVRNLDAIEDALLHMGCSNNVTVPIARLRSAAHSSASESQTAAFDPIIKFIDAQLTDVEAFIEDGGAATLFALQNVLSSNGAVDSKIKDEVLNRLISSDSDTVRGAFPEYLAYLDSLKKKYPSESEIEVPLFGKVSIKESIDEMFTVVAEHTASRTVDFFDLVESFAFKMDDFASAAEVVRRYTPVVGSTCAQAESSAKYSDLKQDRYDYVIIDEAARANPLDLLIPMIMGTRVLLVGDHFQLPHYIEEDVLRRLDENNPNYSKLNRELLTKSFFQLLYENLEAAFKDGRLSCPRTAMLQEQHRMFDDIGNFISKEFYNGELRNAAEVKRFVNDYGIFDGRSIEIIDLPFNKGLEERANISYQRRCEADEIINILKKLVSSNSPRPLDVGVISFYKGQVDLINKMIEETFSEEIREGISCNTVDSFQGREFDIVILSGVRSNTNYKLGFMKDAKSRVNVALSRAKRLLVFVGDVTLYRGNAYLYDFFFYSDELSKRGGSV